MSATYGLASLAHNHFQSLGVDHERTEKQRDELIAERDSLVDSIPELRAAWKAIPSNWNHHGNCIGSPEGRAAMNKLSSAEGRLRSIPDAIERIEREISYQESLANAKQAKKGSSGHVRFS